MDQNENTTALQDRRPSFGWRKVPPRQSRAAITALREDCADLPPCGHRYFSEGCQALGGNIPPGAVGQYFPGDEPGFRCKLTFEMCSDHPPDCPEWKESELVCPACVEYGERHSSRPFKEQKLITRDGEYYCPECYEKYASDFAVAAAAITALRESLDATNWLEGKVGEFEEELEKTRTGIDAVCESLAGLVDGLPGGSR